MNRKRRFPLGVVSGGAPHRRVGGVLAGCLALLLAVSTGCQTARETIQEAWTEPFVPTNYYTVGPLDAEMQRVVVLPLYSGILAPGESLDAMEAVLRSELAKTLRFEVIGVDVLALERMVGRRRLSSSEELPPTLFTELETAYAADGVLFLEITHLHAYRPLQVGLRGTLVSPQDASIQWAFDHVFDAGDPAIEAGARRYESFAGRTGYPIDTTSSVLLSPRRFARYAAFEMFRTLPPRGPALP